MSKYYYEQPENDIDTPMYMDSTDMLLQEQAHVRDMKELKNRLLKQIEETGKTNCGLTSKEEVNRVFWKY